MSIYKHGRTHTRCRLAFYNSVVFHYSSSFCQKIVRCSGLVAFSKYFHVLSLNHFMYHHHYLVPLIRSPTHDLLSCDYFSTSCPLCSASSHTVTPVYITFSFDPTSDTKKSKSCGHKYYGFQGNLEKRKKNSRYLEGNKSS